MVNVMSESTLSVVVMTVSIHDRHADSRNREASSGHMWFSEGTVETIVFRNPRTSYNTADVLMTGLSWKQN